MGQSHTIWAQLQQVWQEGREMYSPWKILSEPRPNCERSTRKKQLKKDIGQEISDRMRKTSWKMMKRWLMTAQNTPAGRSGMVLPLEKPGQHDLNIRVVHKGDKRTLHNCKFHHWHVDHIGPCWQPKHLWHHSDDTACKREQQCDDAQHLDGIANCATAVVWMMRVKG